jgi:hypothetical protein
MSTANPPKKSPAEVISDIASAFGFACRLAIDFGVKKETLIPLLDASYDAAFKLREDGESAKRESARSVKSAKSVKSVKSVKRSLRRRS